MTSVYSNETVMIYAASASLTKATVIFFCRNARYTALFEFCHDKRVLSSTCRPFGTWPITSPPLEIYTPLIEA